MQISERLNMKDWLEHDNRKRRKGKLKESKLIGLKYKYIVNIFNGN